MQKYTFQIFDKSEEYTVIRFFGSSDELIGKRELKTAEIDRLIEEIERV